MELEDALERAIDRNSFFAFVEALIADREDEVAKEKRNPSSPYRPGANGWENGTIVKYLDSALSCTVDRLAIDSRSFPEEPSWRAFADFLYRGKGYE